MATWREIADSALDVDAPARSIDALALRDNPRAIAQRAEGAPRVKPWSITVLDTPGAGVFTVPAGVTRIRYRCVGSGGGGGGSNAAGASGGGGGGGAIVEGVLDVAPGTGGAGGSSSSNGSAGTATTLGSGPAASAGSGWGGTRGLAGPIDGAGGAGGTASGGAFGETGSPGRSRRGEGGTSTPALVAAGHPESVREAPEVQARSYSSTDRAVVAMSETALAATASMFFAIPAVAADFADNIRDKGAPPRDLVAAAKVAIAGEHEEPQQVQDKEPQTRDEQGAALFALLLLVLTGRL